MVQLISTGRPCGFHPSQTISTKAQMCLPPLKILLRQQRLKRTKKKQRQTLDPQNTGEEVHKELRSEMDCFFSLDDTQICGGFLSIILLVKWISDLLTNKKTAFWVANCGKLPSNNAVSKWKEVLQKRVYDSITTQSSILSST